VPELYKEPEQTTGRAGVSLWISGGGYYGAVADRIAKRVATDPTIRARVAELVDEEFAGDAWANARRGKVVR